MELHEGTKLVHDLWPVFAFIVGIVWKQVITHFDVRQLKEDFLDLEKAIIDNEKEINQVKDSLHEAITLQGKETNESIKKLTEVVAELAASTKVMAAELGFLKAKT